MYKRTSGRTNERTNERTNKHTNKQLTFVLNTHSIELYPAYNKRGGIEHSSFFRVGTIYRELKPQF